MIRSATPVRLLVFVNATPPVSRAKPLSPPVVLDPPTPVGSITYSATLAAAMARMALTHSGRRSRPTVEGGIGVSNKPAGPRATIVFRRSVARPIAPENAFQVWGTGGPPLSDP